MSPRLCGECTLLVPTCVQISDRKTRAVNARKTDAQITLVTCTFSNGVKNGFRCNSTPATARINPPDSEILEVRGVSPNGEWPKAMPKQLESAIQARTTSENFIPKIPLLPVGIPERAPEIYPSRICIGNRLCTDPC